MTDNADLNKKLKHTVSRN